MLFTVGGSGVGNTLIWFAAGVGVAVIIGGIMTISAKRRGEASIALWLAQTATSIVLALCALGVVALAVTTIFQTERSLTIPVDVAWPDALPSSEDNGGAILQYANIREADVGISGLSIGVQLLLVASALLGIIAVAAPTLALLILFTCARDGSPFAPGVARWFFIAAVTVFIAGFGTDIVSQFGTSLAAYEVLPRLGIDDGPHIQIQVAAWPIGAALVLAALAAVFRHGRRLQQDTKGLV